MKIMGAAFKELVVPELDRIKGESREIRVVLEVTNKRLDDINTHLADQSRTSDSVREELTRRIDEATTKFATRLDRLYEVIVRRDEHRQVVERLTLLEKDVEEIKRTIAA